MVNKSELAGIAKTLVAVARGNGFNPYESVSAVESMVANGEITYKEAVDVATLVGLKCMKLHRESYSPAYKNCYIEFMKLAEFYYKIDVAYEEE